VSKSRCEDAPGEIDGALAEDPVLGFCALLTSLLPLNTVGNHAVDFSFRTLADAN